MIFGLVYYSMCQALAIAGLFMAVIGARSRHDELSTRYLAIYCGLALITMSMSFQMMLIFSSSKNIALAQALSSSALLGIPVSIFTMPRFVRCILTHPGQRAVNAITGVLGVTGLALLPSGFMALPPWYAYGICMPHYAALAISGIYVAVGIRVALARDRSGSRPLPPFWRRFLGPVFWITVLLLPIALASDIFQFLDTIFGVDSIYLMPLFTASFAVAWFAALLREPKASAALRQESSLPAQAISPESVGAYDWKRISLSAREREVAELLLAGYPYLRIAETLCISPATVKSHVIRVYQKAGVKDKLGLLHAMKSSR